jgi:hypothetical protein
LAFRLSAADGTPVNDQNAGEVLLFMQLDRPLPSFFVAVHQFSAVIVLEFPHFCQN